VHGTSKLGVEEKARGLKTLSGAVNYDKPQKRGAGPHEVLYRRKKHWRILSKPKTEGVKTCLIIIPCPY